MTRTLNQRSFLTPLRIIRPVLGLPLPVTIPLLTVVLHTLKERIILTEAVVVTITTTIAAVVVVPTSSRWAPPSLLHSPLGTILRGPHGLLNHGRHRLVLTPTAGWPSHPTTRPPRTPQPGILGAPPSHSFYMAALPPTVGQMLVMFHVDEVMHSLSLQSLGQLVYGHRSYMLSKNNGIIVGNGSMIPISGVVIPRFPQLTPPST